MKTGQSTIKIKQETYINSDSRHASIVTRETIINMETVLNMHGGKK